MSGGGELLRAVMSENPLRARPKWYTREINFAAADPLGTIRENTFQFNTEAWFLWTNTYVITVQAPFDNNNTAVLPRHPYTRVQFFQSDGRDRSRTSVSEIQFPFSINNASTESDYTLMGPGDYLNIRAFTTFIQVELMTVIMIEGIEYVYG